MKETKTNKNQSPLWLVFLLAASCGLIAAKFILRPASCRIDRQFPFHAQINDWADCHHDSAGIRYWTSFYRTVQRYAENRLLNRLRPDDSCLRSSYQCSHAPCRPVSFCSLPDRHWFCICTDISSLLRFAGSREGTGRMVGNVMSGLLLGIMAASSPFQPACPI